MTMIDEVQRLILLNQFQILLKVSDSDKDENENAVNILSKGIECEYDRLFWKLQHPVVKDESDFVHDVLLMYNELGWGYDRLDDKSGLDPEYFIFRGFDGNSESSLIKFAEYKLNGVHYTSVKTASGDLNCHFPTREMYERMLRKFKSFETPDEGRYPRDFMKEVINERVHPENRK